MLIQSLNNFCDSLIYTDAFYFLQMIHYYKEKYLNTRKFIVVSMTM